MSTIDFWKEQGIEVFDSYVEKPEEYFDPDQWEIREAAEKYNLHLSKDVRDSIREGAYFFANQILDTDYIKEKYKEENILEDTPEDKKKWVESKREFYKQLEGTSIPGRSPLQQACNLMVAMQESKKNNPNRSQAETLEAAISLLDAAREHIDDEELQEVMVVNKQSYNPFKKVNFTNLNTIGLIESFGSEFKIEKQVDTNETNNGKIPAVKKMTSFSQVHKIDLTQMLYPDFDYKLATKNLRINTRLDKVEHKQKIITIVDDSGSMSIGTKQKWIATLIVDRLRFVMREEAEMYIGYYNGHVHSMHHVYDKESALSFWSNYYFKCDEGGTDLGWCIQDVKRNIESGNFYGLGDLSQEEDIEILVVSDANDRIQGTFPWKVNAFTLMDTLNKGLRDMCIQSGGKYIYVTEGGIEEFSQTGSKKTKFKI